MFSLVSDSAALLISYTHPEHGPDEDEPGRDNSTTFYLPRYNRGMIKVYTDGACEPNPGPGGWAAVILNEDGTPKLTLCGGESQTTNNRQEYTAALSALLHLPEGLEVQIHTDSELLVKTMTLWARDWVSKGVLGKKKNADLVTALLNAESRHKRVVWTWVRGHAGNQWNEHCDHVAGCAVDIARSGAFGPQEWESHNV